MQFTVTDLIAFCQYIGFIERMHDVEMVAHAYQYYLSAIHACFGHICM